MPKFRVHRINFYKFQPNAIHCLCYDELSSLLAVSRADCSIEIWNLKNTPCLERVIAGTVGASVESVVWCRGRLFSTGLAAYVLEYDINALTVKHSLSVIGGPAWCLAASKDQKYLATGTEDGYISLFEVEEHDFSLCKTFDKQEGRILCLAWHESGQSLATGSIDTIRIWNVERGQTVCRILVSRLERNIETIVWCLAYLKDETIVSGDSWGRAIFWDGRTGTQQSSTRIHKADILTLCVDKSETNVYVSGVHPVVSMFTRVFGKEGKGGWMKSYSNTMHTHDVRATTIAGKYLISGGVDTYLVLSVFKKKKVVLKYPPFLQASLVQAAPGVRCLLFQYPNSLDLWQVGSTNESDGADGTVFTLSETPKHLLQLQMKEGEQVVCSAISQDGRWMAYVTCNGLRLFSLAWDSLQGSSEKQPTLQRVRLLPPECQEGRSMTFAPDGRLLILATADGELGLLATDQNLPTLLHTFPSCGVSERQHLVTCSANGRHFATATHTGKVTVYSLERREVLCSLPRSQSQATALAFSPNNSNYLVVAYSDQRVVEFDVSKRAYTVRSRRLQESPSFLSPDWPVVRITFDPRNPSAVMLHDHVEIYFLDADLTSSPTKVKKQRFAAEDSAQEGDHQNVKKCQKYKHLLAFVHLEADEMLAVENSPQKIQDSLPAAFKRKTFGT